MLSLCPWADTHFASSATVLVYVCVTVVCQSVPGQLGIQRQVTTTSVNVWTGWMEEWCELLWVLMKGIKMCNTVYSKCMPFIIMHFKCSLITFPGGSLCFYSAKHCSKNHYGYLIQAFRDFLFSTENLPLSSFSCNPPCCSLESPLRLR